MVSNFYFYKHYYSLTMNSSPSRTLNFGSPTRTLNFGSPSGAIQRRRNPAPVRRTAFLEGVLDAGIPGTPTSDSVIGEGSYGTVFKANTPQGKVAVKETEVNIKHTKDLGSGKKPLSREEAMREIKSLNSPGAVPGVALQSHNEEQPHKNNVSMVVPKCEPVTPGDLPEIESVIGVADEHLIYDLKPDNVMKAPVGTLIPNLVDGKIVYHPTKVEQVFITDLTYMEDQEDGDREWCPLNAVSDIRAFKRRMFEEWARNPTENPDERRERVESEFH